MRNSEHITVFNMPNHTNTMQREGVRIGTPPEKWREYGRCWHVQNTERVKSYARTRRALERGATVRDFTAAQWLAMQEQYNHRCVYCPPNCWRCQRKRHALTQDHIVPFSKGGNHTWSDIVPACKSCNSKKHTGPILSPVQSLLFLLPEP